MCSVATCQSLKRHFCRYLRSGEKGAYKFSQKWEIGQKSPASTCPGKTDAANPIKPFKTSSNQRFRKFWGLLLRMPEAGLFAIRAALAVEKGGGGLKKEKKAKIEHITTIIK